MRDSGLMPGRFECSMLIWRMEQQEEAHGKKVRTNNGEIKGKAAVQVEGTGWNGAMHDDFIPRKRLSE